MKKKKKKISYLEKNSVYRARIKYTQYFENLKINKNVILFESFNGLNFSGAPYYIFLEIYNNSQYDGFEKVIVINKKNEKNLLNFLEINNIDKVKIVIRNSDEYCKLLATAKYLINNVTFPDYFIRKNEQIYWNTWHGTPLKALGRSIKNNPAIIGNVQRNFIHATHLSYSNEFTFDNVRKDYMIEQLFRGEYLLGGYPANDIFFDKKHEKATKEKIGLKGKKIVVYMPTWRDKEPKKKHNKQMFYIMHALYNFDKNLDDDTVVLVKLHHLGNKKINFNDFDKIKAFPKEFETYEILNIADILITDYSSVMFDFLNKNKPILLYTFDKEEYMSGRSMYFDIEKLPFFQTNDIYKLCDEINNCDFNVNYEKVKRNFCQYDRKNSSKKLCEYVFQNKKCSSVNVIPAKNFYNDKKNILIFCGTLLKNGITTALKSLIANLDVNKYNYYLCFTQKAGERDIDFVNSLDSDIKYIPIRGAKNLLFLESLAQRLYFKYNVKNRILLKYIDNIFERESHRLILNNKFDVAIHFSGYERDMIYLLHHSSKKCIINTHSNMLMESKMRSNIHTPSIEYAYKEYDKITIVRDTMKEEISNHIKWVDINKIKTLHNLNDIEGIKKKSKLPISFDSDTECNYSMEELENILNSNSIKFINIARFSVEKGLDRLIEAFQMFNKDNPNSYLIIIGGHGALYKKTLEKANELNNVVIIKSLRNPMNILSKCDLFVLSSLYEGLPMTIMEALILKKPVISTDIPSIRSFFSEGYGYLVENSTKGLYNGMIDFKNNKLKELKKFNAEEFNKVALKEFYDVVENGDV